MRLFGISASVLMLAGSLGACSSTGNTPGTQTGSQGGSAQTGGQSSGGQSNAGQAGSHAGNSQGGSGQSGSGGDNAQGGEQAAAGATAGGGSSNGGNGGSVMDCPDHPRPGGTETPCHDSSDCMSPNVLCTSAGTFYCGGVAPPPPCATDTDCAMQPLVPQPGTVCDPLRDTGACNYSGNCYPPCTETACLQYQRCSSDNLHCEWVPCGDGYECFEGELCDPEFATVDVHGCRAANCVSDGYECPEGSLCYPDAGNLRATTQDAHGCVQMHCSEGFVCPVNTDCDDQEPNTGCVTRSCASDTDCDCGPCIQEMCFGQWWVCSLPPPP